MALLVLPSVGRGHGWRPGTPNPNDETKEFGDLLFKGIKPTLALTGKVGFTDRFHHPSIRDQGLFGSCTGHGPRTALQTLMRFKGRWQYARTKREPELSPRHAYLLGRIKEASLHEDAGCEIADVIDMIVEHGIAPENLMPYPAETTSATWPVMCEMPSEEARKRARWYRIKASRYRVRTPEQFLQALANKLPIVGGFVCTNHTFDRPDGFLLHPQQGDVVEGGHCVPYLEADCDAGIAEFANSWSELWGTKGYGKQELRWLHNGYMSDCWAVELHV
jgi:hypothetical protein